MGLNNKRTIKKSCQSGTLRIHRDQCAVSLSDSKSGGCKPALVRLPSRVHRRAATCVLASKTQVVDWVATA